MLAVVEFARNVLGWHDANSTELTLTTHRLLTSARSRDIAGRHHAAGRVHLQTQARTREHEAYQQETVVERHRHRYELKTFTAIVWPRPAWFQRHLARRAAGGN